MGLDVYLHTNFTGRKKKELSDEDFDSGDWVCNFVISKHWRDRNGDLDQDVWYELKDYEHVVGYSYSTHSQFRQTLADVAHSGILWEHIDEGDFYKFIDFADNEGTITWTTAGELAKDFKKWHAAYMKKYEDHPFWKGVYESWMNGLERCAIEKGIINYR